MENSVNDNKNVEIISGELKEDSNLDDKFSNESTVKTILNNNSVPTETETDDNISSDDSDTLLEDFEDIEDTLLSKERKPIKLPKSEKPVKPKTKKKDDTDPKLLEIKEIIKSGDIVKLKAKFDDFTRGKSFYYTSEFANQVIDNKGNTLLHIAVKYDRIKCINLILGWQPDFTVQNYKDKAPYALVKSQKARDRLLSMLRWIWYWDHDESFCHKAQISLKEVMTEEDILKNKSVRVQRKEKKREKLKKQKEEKEKKGLGNKKGHQ